MFPSTCPVADLRLRETEEAFSVQEEHSVGCSEILKYILFLLWHRYRRGGGVIRRQRHRKRARMCEISQRTESLRDSGLMAAINSGTYISSALTAKPVWQTCAVIRSEPNIQHQQQQHEGSLFTTKHHLCMKKTKPRWHYVSTVIPSMDGLLLFKTACV